MSDMASCDFSLSWSMAEIQDLVAYDQLLGQKVVESGGIFWRRVRPFFYRPLLPFREYPSNTVAAPLLGRMGGFQHVVPPHEPSNSFLNMLIYEDIPGYSLRSLSHHRRRQVHTAEASFTIRPIESVEEFKQKGHPVYLSFYERTRYAYGDQRRNRDSFSIWANALFQVPKLVILGGYRASQLGAIGISIRIGDAIVYLTYFCDSESLQLGVSDLMLHSIRTAAAKCPGVKRLFTGMYAREKSDFYLLRGCKCTSMPARLHLNPLVSILLKRGMPGVYMRLRGADSPVD